MWTLGGRKGRPGTHWCNSVGDGNGRTESREKQMYSWDIWELEWTKHGDWSDVWCDQTIQDGLFLAQAAGQMVCFRGSSEKTGGHVSLRRLLVVEEPKSKWSKGPLVPISFFQGRQVSFASLSVSDIWWGSLHTPVIIVCASTQWSDIYERSLCIHSILVFHWPWCPTMRWFSSSIFFYVIFSFIKV